MIVLALAGGGLGFYIEHRHELSHKRRLQHLVPQLEADLAAAVERRQRLQSQLEQLSNHQSA